MKKDNEKNEVHEDDEREVVGKLIRLQDILNFFKYDIAPSNLEARTEKLAAKALLGSRQINFMLIIAIGALLLFGSIAYMIISSNMNQSACVELAKQAVQSRVVAPAPQNAPITSPGMSIT